MKRGFTSKQERKQAEDAIIRDMNKILRSLKQNSQQNADNIKKERVMTVLTRYLKLKNDVRLENIIFKDR